MRARPLILVTTDIESEGKEFGDLSISLSAKYHEALLAVGCLPLAMPVTISAAVIAECVQCSDGVLLTGGDDVESRLYASALPPRVRQTVGVTPDGGARDLRELLVVDEVFRQRKPLLAICRGHQILNVALGGTLVADIPAQLPGALEHRRNDRRNEIAHEVRLTAGSFLATITGKQTLGVNSTHHQAVARVAPPLRAAALGSDGVVEGIELKPDAMHWLPFLVSVQFHPERLMDRYPEHGAIFSAFARACSLKRK
jgi:putative glutamine amidotransferase